MRTPDIFDVLSDRFILLGAPDHISSGNGPEFVAKAERWADRAVQNPARDHGYKAWLHWHDASVAAGMPFQAIRLPTVAYGGGLVCV